jgi:probable rRNA maturation factor
MNSCSASSKLTREMTVQVDVQHAADGESALSSDDIAAWVARAVDATGGPGDAELSVRVVDAAEMQQLNKEYRGNDKPTNVLSFPAGDIAGLPEDAGAPLGDLVVCASVVKDEAELQGKSLEDHWAHMIVHGTLHLLGFDHEEDAAAADMESREVGILTAHGIANPYTI